MKLRGLFSSSRRMAPTAGEGFTAYADPTLDDPITRTLGVDEMKRAPVMAEDPERSFLGGLIKYTPPGDDAPPPLATFGATLADIGAALRGGEGGALARVQEDFRKRAGRRLKLEQDARLREMAARLYGDDPEALALFMADPEAFVKARAEAYKPQTLSEGQTYRDRMTGESYTAPIYEKFDDRFGFIDPNTGRSGYSAARGPTFQEETGRLNYQESARTNRANEGLRAQSNATSAFSARTGRMAHDARERAGGYGTPGSGAPSDLSHMSTQDLINALRNAQ